MEIDLPKAMPLACASPALTGFFVSLVARTLVPLAVMLALALAGGIVKRARGPDHPVVSMCSSGWFFLLFLVYPGCTSAVFRAFICDTLEDGTQMLRADYSVVCWEGEHLPIAAYAVLMAIVYPIGTPLLYTAMIYANKGPLQKIKRAEMAAEAEETQITGRRRSLTVSKNQPATLDPMEARKETAQKEARRLREELPAALHRLTSGYDMRCYWCEPACLCPSWATRALPNPLLAERLLCSASPLPQV